MYGPKCAKNWRATLKSSNIHPPKILIGQFIYIFRPKSQQAVQNPKNQFFVNNFSCVAFGPVIIFIGAIERWQGIIICILWKYGVSGTSWGFVLNGAFTHSYGYFLVCILLLWAYFVWNFQIWKKFITDVGYPIPRQKHSFLSSFLID